MPGYWAVALAGDDQEGRLGVAIADDLAQIGQRAAQVGAGGAFREVWPEQAG
jgi:hypothetical protein